VKEEQPSKVNIFINFHSLAIYNRIWRFIDRLKIILTFELQMD
jgi:hypothetical protein